MATIATQADITTTAMATIATQADITTTAMATIATQADITTTARTTAGDCVQGTKLDPPTSIRVGGDYKQVSLPANASIQDCVTSCCADPVCVAFSFNFGGTGGSTKDQSICKHKNPSNRLIGNNTCVPDAKGVPTCLSGAIAPRPTPAPSPVCNGQSWDKSCGPTMPGPMKDCCGPANSSYKGNAGCGE
jgi:hypothetical protein